MEWEGKVRSSSFACSATGRALAPGELFFSGLVQNPDATFSRLDYCSTAWEQVDRGGLLSWWRQRVPVPTASRRQVRFDADLLRRLFTDLQSSRDRAQQCLCYVIALCLVRIRSFSLLEVDPAGPWLLLEDKADRVRLRLRDPRMSPDDEAGVQRQLLDIIGLGEPA